MKMEKKNENGKRKETFWKLRKIIRIKE